MATMTASDVHESSHSIQSNGNLDYLGKRNYVRWDAEGVEEKPPNEDEDIQAVADQINAIQRAQFNMHRHSFGGTHARTHGIIKGKFIVPDDLAPHLKQTELFSTGGEYPIIARYSTEPGDPGLDDRIAQPRGFAMKIFNVHGDMFDAGKDFPTQDIEFNSTPALDLANAKVTKEIIGLRIAHGHDKDRLYEELEKRDDTDLQKARDGVRNTHLESTRQYSQTAYRFGNYVIKYCLVPSSETQRRLYEETVRPEHGSDILHRWLQNFHKQHEAQYLFQVQLLENLNDQPVEYAGKIWDAEKYPWQTVARVVFPAQESFDYERKSFWEDHMRVDPWHGLKALQPLGSPNRLRRVGQYLASYKWSLHATQFRADVIVSVYPASSSLRRKLNGRKEINVTSIDEIP
ncbi:MAG: hypothetical protein M1821_007824 [Bathelium mastoideum]|nr:MAG: hypothetical protein M1821_007824 [Bathelium mastoideum]KAI9688579.1 MAG: hypothetical protein M1822_001528 [Bathelium mastoideum]